MSLTVKLVLIAAVAGAPLTAQPVDQYSTSRIHDRWVDTKEDARPVLIKFASCIQRGDPRRSREIVLSSDYGLDEQHQDVLSNFCLPTNGRMIALSLTPTVIKFALANAIFDRELRDSDPGKLVSAPPIQYPLWDEPRFQKALVKAKGSQQENDLLERRRVFQRNVSYFHFGECVVRTDPVAAKSLLMTKIESSQESSALQALLPVLRKCQASESQISLHKDDVRGTIAVNYVRLALAPQVLGRARQ